MKKVKKIIGLLLSIVVCCWIAVVVIDYYKAVNDKDLLFCIKDQTKKYDDGTVYRCDGVGYRFYKYDRDGVKATQFGPFFIEEKTIEELKANQNK